ncbi:MAG: ATP-binding protein [Rhodothermales bacterium]
MPATRTARGPSPTARAYERLLEISVHLNSTRDLDDLLLYIIETAASVLNCEAASLLLFDEEAGQLRFAAATGSDAEALAAIPVPLHGSLAGRIFAQNQPLIEQDVASAPDHFEEVGEKVQFRTRSLLGVPMRIAGQPTGVLEALNKRSGTFTAADVEILSILASHAAIALRNARQIQSLQQALGKLQSFDTLKSDFMALASHELRTPLSTILGVLDLLSTEVEDVLASFVQDAVGAGEQMTKVIDTMTQLESLRGDAGRVSKQTVAIQEVLKAVEDAMAARAAAQGHRVCVVLPETPLLVDGDAEGLQSLFANLWENALQFTPEGGTVCVTVAKYQDTVTVAIQDSGIGIDKAQLEAIFGEFYQVEDHLTRTHGGLGLGLTLARKVAERHGGWVWAESKGLRHGTTMNVVLPVCF